MDATQRKLETSKGTDKGGADSKPESIVEESTELLEEIRIMNEKQISEGKYMLNVMIPDKISRIDAYIKEGDLWTAHS